MTRANKVSFQNFFDVEEYLVLLREKRLTKWGSVLMHSSIPTQIDKLNLRNHLMNLQTSEELITAEIQVSLTGQYLRLLLQMAKLLKKFSKI